METKIQNRGRVAFAVVAMILVAGVVTVSLLRERLVSQQIWQVSVNGRGTVEYQPDEATVNLAVKIDKKKEAAEALAELSDRLEKVLLAVKNLNIAAANIQTQAYSLYPEYEYLEEKSTLVGYSAYQNLAVKITGLKEGDDLVTKVVAAATKAGANEVGGISFSVSNLDDLKQQARVKAITDARERAGELARAAGVDLAEVIGWWENYVQGPGNANAYYYDGKGGGGYEQVSGGLQEVVMEIGVNYKLAD